jgi:hypothetical protein
MQMLMILMLAAAGAAPTDSLAPAFTRVTTSFRCASTERSITTVKTAAGISVEAVTAGGHPLARGQLAGIKAGLATVDRIDEIVPQCQDGPYRILIRGHSGPKKRNMMIFFGPNGAAAVREVG